MTATQLSARLSERSDRLVLYNLDWDFYESLLKLLDERHVFATYYKGTLELMSPSYPHDRVARLLCRLIQTLAEELDIPIASAGSTTWRRKARQAGLEADESFFLKSEPRIRGKRKIDLRRDPPPDLAIEVEFSRRLHGMRMKAYAKLGIGEVWRFRTGNLRFMLLQPSGQYAESQQSPTFPQFEPAELARLIEQGLAANETAWIRDLRGWVRRRLAR